MNRPLFFLIASLIVSTTRAQAVDFKIAHLGTYNCDFSIPLGGPPQSCDFNHDGKLDLSCLPSAAHLTILQRSMRGTFDQLDYDVTPSFGGSVYQHTWEDMNNDGTEDLVTKVIGTTPQGVVWINDGQGHLTQGPSFSLDTFHNLMSVSDLNGDGIGDIVTIDFIPPAGADEPGFYVQMSDGLGSWMPRQYLHTANGTSFVGDFDGDGRKDIALWRRTNRQDRRFVRFFSNNGDSTFQDNGDVRLGAGEMAGAADFNRDGKCDLFGYSSAFLRTESMTEVTRFTFTPTPPNFSVFGDDRFYVGDFNGDGRTDVLNTGMNAQNRLAYVLYAGASDGTMVASSRDRDLGDYGSGLNSLAFATDWDGDGRTDLVQTRFDGVTHTTKVSLLRSTAPKLIQTHG